MFVDPGDWWSGEGPRNPWGAAPDPNGEALRRLGLVIALALFVASLYPHAMMAAFLCEAFSAGAFATAILAMLREEPVQAAQLTLWDEAAALQLLGLIAKFFIHRDAVFPVLKIWGATLPF